MSAFPFRDPPRPSAVGLDPAELLRRRGRPWIFRVTGKDRLTPRMIRVSFTGDDLDELVWRPGQDLVLSLPQAGGEDARRHYTIRRHRGDQLEIDFVLHGDSPAGRWTAAARVGDVIHVMGPRGRTTLAEDAGFHLFCGDETCLPAIFAMIESLPAEARATALLEVGSEADIQPLTTAADVAIEWLSRAGAPPGPNRLILDRLLALAPKPDGAHAYVIGETSNVRAQRHALLDKGFESKQITAEGYWRPDRVGGHDHI